MTKDSSGSSLNTFLGIAGVIISVASLYAAANGDASDPYFTVAFAAVGIVGSFMAGLNARAARDRLNDFVDAKLARAATEAVEQKLPDMEAKLDEALDKVLEEIANGRY